MSENESQKLRTEFQGVETRLDGVEKHLNGLEKRINERFEQSEKQRDKRFDKVENRLASIDESLKKLAADVQSNGKDLKKLDEDIRGNGKDGLNTRLNHAEKLQKIFLWAGGIALGGFFALLAVFAAKYLDLVDQLRNSV